MNDDDRLHRHLAEQADAISLTPADPAAAMRRGTRRRNRRRAAIAGVAAVAVVGSSFAVIDRDDPDATVDSSLAAAVVPSGFDWTVLAPDTGLGYSRATTLAGGAVYSLSSAPGPADESGMAQPHLYRSEDGADWAEVSLPSGVRPSSLGSSGDVLYAIGTAPASGGGRDLVVSTSTDGAASWSSVTLPPAVAELEARHPGEIMLNQPTVAATDATHLVASVVVSANPDVEALLPERARPNGGWSLDEDGVTVYEAEPCAEPANDAGCAAIPSTLKEGDVATGRRLEEPTVLGTFSWDELGLDPELRELVNGRTYVYASDDGATFEPATLPAGASGWGGQVLATDDGYRLFLGRADAVAGEGSTLVLRSADGHTWAEDSSIPGSPMTTGLLGDRPALALFQDDGLTVVVNQPDGSWAPLDLRAAVGGGAASGVQDVAFGPLGLAAVVWTDGDPATTHLVHSADGSTLSVVALADHLDRSTVVLGLGVTADAIAVRVADASDQEAGSVPTQHVLVGTPR